jgi:hypothetical protein
MREARQGVCAMQGKADAQCKASQVSNARQGRCGEGQGRCEMQGREDAPGNLGQCAMQGRAYAQGKAGRMLETLRTREAMQS